MNNRNLVFIYTIPRPSALGLSEWTSDTSGVKLKKTKVGKTADYIRALYSPTIGGLANHISYTPWMEAGEPQLDAAGKPQMLQTKYEEKWNLPKGFLHNRPFGFHVHSNKAPEELSFFQSYRWKLVDGCTVLDKSKMEDEMGYFTMLASSKVANSEREYRMHKWPKAQWYIALENESEEIKYEKSLAKTHAYAALHSTELTDNYKRKLVSLLGLVDSTSSISQQLIHNTLTAFIENSSAGPGSNIEKFQYYVNLLKTQDGRERFEAMWTLKQAIDLRIIDERQDTYTWKRPSGTPLPIADRYSEAVDFFINPKKSVEQEEIQSQIDAKLPR